MENMLNEAREAIRKVGEKVEPVLENVREKAEPVIDNIRDGAGDAFERVKRAAKDVGARVGSGEIRNEFFDTLTDEAKELKDAACRKAGDMQKKLEALMRGDRE